MTISYNLQSFSNSAVTRGEVTNPAPAGLGSSQKHRHWGSSSTAVPHLMLVEYQASFLHQRTHRAPKKRSSTSVEQQVEALSKCFAKTSKLKLSVSATGAPVNHVHCFQTDAWCPWPADPVKWCFSASFRTGFVLECRRFLNLPCSRSCISCCELISGIRDDSSIMKI